MTSNANNLSAAFASAAGAPVRALLTEAGRAALMATLDGYNQWVTYADNIAALVTCPLNRAKFVALAAGFLAEVDPAPLNGPSEWQWSALEDARPTPCGPVELWAD